MILGGIGEVPTGLLTEGVGTVAGGVTILGGLVVAGNGVVNVVKGSTGLILLSSNNSKSQSTSSSTGTGQGGTSAQKPAWPGNNPKQAPPGTQWHGASGSTPGSRQGNYYNPSTGESFHPDLDHPDPIGPHWDYRASDGTWYRITHNGNVIPK